MEPNRKELMEIGGLIDAGLVRPFVEAIFPLEDAREAFEHGLNGHARGKLVSRVAEKD